MKLGRLIAIVLLLAATLAGNIVRAEDAPVPMPRPSDRMPEGVQPPAGEGTQAPEAAPNKDAGSEDESAPDSPAAAPSPAPSTASDAAAALVAGKPQHVTLRAQVTDEGEPISNGVVWRVFETRADSAGELALAARSNDATANLDLVPGEYVVHVAYGRAQTTDTITVKEGDNSKSIVLDAGALRLNASVAGDVSIPINLLHFDIYAGESENTRALVAENLGANEIVTLNAGTYHVVSYFGDVNAEVRADLRVQPGQLTDATLYHKAAQVSFKLVTEPGGEAIADIDWTVKAGDGSTVFTNTGAFPATVLAEGDYEVLAKRGETVYNRAFEVKPGQPREIEVLTAVY